MRRCAGLELTELERRALAGAGSCGEDDDAVAVMDKRLGAACAVNDDSGAAGARRLSLQWRRRRKCDTGGVAECGRVLGT